jgi:hypothetical protein
MRTTRRLRPLLALLAGCLLMITGCASTTAGVGGGSGVAPTTAPPSSSETTTTPPSSSDTTTAPSTPVGTSPVAGGCAGDYCDDFSSASTGWDVGNEKFFFSRYSPYLGGTLQMGERHDSVLTVPAPYDLTKAAADYSVRVDAELIVGSQSPANAIYGLSCWNHKSNKGDTAAFVFYVTKRSAQIVLWDNVDGTEHVLKRKALHNVLQPAPYRNKLRVVCLQRHLPSGTAVAELGMLVNGKVLTDNYSKSTKNHAWDVGDRASLIVGLTNSNAFYDNVVITGECKGSSC